MCNSKQSWLPNVPNSGPNSFDFEVCLHKLPTLSVATCSTDRLSSLNSHLEQSAIQRWTSGSPSHLAYPLKTWLLALRAHVALRVKSHSMLARRRRLADSFLGCLFAFFFAPSGPPVLPLLVIQPRQQTRALSTREKLWVIDVSLNCLDSHFWQDWRTRPSCSWLFISRSLWEEGDEDAMTNQPRLHCQVFAHQCRPVTSRQMFILSTTRSR